MDAKKKKAIMECKSYDELLNAEYGERGTEERERFEAEVDELLAMFNTDKISQNDVDRECELAREELYNVRHTVQAKIPLVINRTDFDSSLNNVETKTASI